MKLPKLPKKLQNKEYQFRRRKRETVASSHVDYGVYDGIGMFAGILTYDIIDKEVIMIYNFLKNQTKIKLNFEMLMKQWKKEQQYKKEIRDIVESI